MPPASQAEFEGINSFIFKMMSTLPLRWLCARDEHSGEGQDVSFTRWEGG